MDITKFMQDPGKPRRKSIRIPWYDYSKPGAYFVTICVKDKRHLFGKVVNGEMCLNEFGRVVTRYWIWLSEQYHHVDLDTFIVMPNHFHGIVMVNFFGCRGASRGAPTTRGYKRKPLGQLVGAFKTVSTKFINKLRNAPGAPLWQRNYYEHVVRNEIELNELREYIITNPIRWEMDEYYVKDL